MAGLATHSMESYASGVGVGVGYANDARVFSPSVGRNKEPIREVLSTLLTSLEKAHPDKDNKMVMEVACGTGEHCAHFAAALPGWAWQPTDMTSELFTSVRAHSEGLPNVRLPYELDVRWEEWPLPPHGTHPLAIQCANMCHISPWDTTLGLLKGAARILLPGGLLMIYGAFQVDGQHTSQSNVEFDAMLRDREPSWGVRDTAEMDAVARGMGMRLRDSLPMPANNFILVFEKDSGTVVPS